MGGQRISLVSLPTVLLGFSFMYFDLFIPLTFISLEPDHLSHYFCKVQYNVSLDLRERLRCYHNSNLAGKKLISFLGRELIPNIH